MGSYARETPLRADFHGRTNDDATLSSKGSLARVCLRVERNPVVWRRGDETHLGFLHVPCHEYVCSCRDSTFTDNSESMPYLGTKLNIDEVVSARGVFDSVSVNATAPIRTVRRAMRTVALRYSVALA